MNISSKVRGSDVIQSESSGSGSGEIDEVYEVGLVIEFEQVGAKSQI